MTTIAMQTTIETGIRTMCSEAVTNAVDLLAEKYGFDKSEALRLFEGDLKIERKAESPKPKKERTKKEKKASDPDKPKRAKTGYLLYSDEVREEVREELLAALDEGQKLKPQEVVQAIAARWREEDQAVKDEWNTKAKTPVTSDDSE